MAYGKEGLEIEVPDRNLVQILRMKENPVISNPRSETLKKIESPVGTPPLSELAKKVKTACIIVSDITRPVPNTTIVPPIIEVLERSGIKSENI